MPIRVKCRSCSKQLRLKDSAAGKTIKCPDCKETIRVRGVEPSWDDYDEEEYEPQPRRRRPSTKNSSGSGRNKRKKSKKKTNQTPLIIGSAICGVVIVVVVAVLMSGDGDTDGTGDSVASTDGGSSTDSTDVTPNATTPKDVSNTQTLDDAVNPTETASGQADGSDQIGKFDHDAWNKASAQLKASGISASLEEASDIGHLGAGLTHLALIDLPLPRFEKLPVDLWSKISPVSHIFIRTEHINGLQMQKLAEHPGLIGVNIASSYVGTGDGLIALQKHRGFRALHLSVPMGPVSERLIGELTGLRTLGLNHASVSNDTLASILKLTELRSLSLQGSSVDDDGIAHIVRLTQLRTLFLNGSKVTDKGLKELASLKSLTLCDVRDLAVSSQAIADLQSKLPNCKIFK